MEPGRGREGQVEPRLSPEDAAEARKILHAPEVSNEVKDTVREILVQDQERRLGQLRQEFTDNQGNPRTPLHAKLLQHAETELNSLKTAESPGNSSQPSQPDSDVTVVLPTATSSHGTSQQPHQQTTQPETAQAISFGDFSENLSRNHFAPLRTDNEEANLSTALPAEPPQGPNSSAQQPTESEAAQLPDQLEALRVLRQELEQAILENQTSLRHIRDDYTHLRRQHDPTASARYGNNENTPTGMHRELTGVTGVTNRNGRWVREEECWGME
ncbi:hypothetical protein NFJ02_36g91160 [Pycnococcus provasolii]